MVLTCVTRRKQTNTSHVCALWVTTNIAQQIRSCYFELVWKALWAHLEVAAYSNPAFGACPVFRPQIWPQKWGQGCVLKPPLLWNELIYNINKLNLDSNASSPEARRHPCSLIFQMSPWIITVLSAPAAVTFRGRSLPPSPPVVQTQRACRKKKKQQQKKVRPYIESCPQPEDKKSQFQLPDTTNELSIALNTQKSTCPRQAFLHDAVYNFNLPTMLKKKKKKKKNSLRSISDSSWIEKGANITLVRRSHFASLFRK